jgi:hypothetical protein
MLAVKRWGRNSACKTRFWLNFSYTSRNYLQINAAFFKDYLLLRCKYNNKR